MEENPLSELPLFIRRHLPLIGVSLVGLILLGYGLILSFAPPQEDSVVFEESSMEEASEKSVINSEITVDIAGAVKKPGVYTLPPDSRMKDALVAAGGATEEADAEYLSKQVNLAQKLTDSSKIYIPFEGEAVSAASVMGSATTSSLININTASLSELDTLPKIGPVTAQKIIDNRPYSSLEGLKTKKAVSTSVYTAIEKLITVN